LIRDRERVARLVDEMSREGVDVLLCGSPSNVLLLSGYWPVVGTSVALVTRDGEVAVLVPADEQRLAKRSWADAVYVMDRARLTDTRTTRDHVLEGLRHMAGRHPFRAPATIGCDGDGAFEPTTYAASWRFGAALADMIVAAFPGARVQSVVQLLHRQRARLTEAEVARTTTACRVAARAFEHGGRQLEPGMSEVDAAAGFRATFERDATTEADARAVAFAWCMAGPNAAEAGGAYARSRSTPLLAGELALIHFNAAVNGMWTDLTRTFVLGEPTVQQARMYDAVLGARAAAFDTMRAGVPAAQVDAAARDVLRRGGFGEYFTHGLGHGVGFGAISHEALPRLHPASSDVLETNMVCNIEPAIYVPARSGLRHCDMARVTEHGAELLTPFQTTCDELIAGAARHGTIHA
jgi:Xaa-Pro aminopeptidase